MRNSSICDERTGLFRTRSRYRSRCFSFRDIIVELRGCETTFRDEGNSIVRLLDVGKGRLYIGRRRYVGDPLDSGWLPVLLTELVENMKHGDNTIFEDFLDWSEELDVVGIEEQLSYIGWEWVFWFQEDVLGELSKQNIKAISASFSFLFSYRIVDLGSGFDCLQLLNKSVP
jgi:hypothetical protein